MVCTQYNQQYDMSRNSTFPHSPGRGLTPFCDSGQALVCLIRRLDHHFTNYHHSVLKHHRMSGNEYTLGLISKVRDQARALR